jgi:D-serine deaminase-like pyridoxal phosphate-dependent protein
MPFELGLPMSAPDTPALCLDLEPVKSSVQRMAGVMRQSGVSLRPHVKTHKSPVLARMQVAADDAEGVVILPNLGCTTINLHDRYHVVHQGRLTAIWPGAARGASS